MVDFGLLYDKSIFQREIHEKHYVKRILSCKNIKNATILPCVELPTGESGGGIVDLNGTLISESTVHNGSHVAYKVEPDSIIKSNETVIYFGMLNGIWGHCITDCIKRAWFFSAKLYKEKYANYKVFYIAPKGSFHRNFLSILEKLGIDIDSFIEITKPTEFSEVIIPDSSFYLDDNGIEHFTDEYRESIEIIKKSYKKDLEERNKKIYYSHRNVRGYNNDIGEEKIERYLEEQGFDIIHPEKFSVDEQLEMLSKCSIFVASDGSTSHNSVFLPEDAEVIIIPRSPYLTFHQLALNELYDGQKIYYIDATLSILCKGDRPTRGPFFYFVSPNLIKHIENREFVENDKWIKENFRDFEGYLRRGFYIENNRTFTAKSPYTELSMYYFNKYLFLKKPRKILVSTGRKIDHFISRVTKKIVKLLQSFAK